MTLKTKTSALAALRGLTEHTPAASSPAPAPHAAPATMPAEEPRRMGRPPAPEETMQISLRLPKAWHVALHRRAVEASAAEGKTISPQEIVRRFVEKGLNLDG